jgi:hypothetical protein
VARPQDHYLSQENGGHDTLNLSVILVFSIRVSLQIRLYAKAILEEYL